MNSDESTDARVARGNRLLTIALGSFAAVAVLVLLFAAILNWQHIPEDQVRKVRLGMTHAEVRAILGEPATGGPGGTMWIWNRKGLFGIVVVQFEDGKVSDAFNES